MSVTTQAIVQGTVARVSERKVIGTQGANAGKEFVIKSAVVVGDHCLAEVSFRDPIGLPKQGDFVTIAVEVSSFRDDDQCRAIGYVEARGPAKAAA